ncbi:hypothetical protein [Kineococcus glutinatus]|uniref:Metallophosphoesterase n=1 Tax=Kineococcus glutinatus TaxID=1070872 RepID=A0ABP9I1M2_9ACTN
MTDDSTPEGGMAGDGLLLAFDVDCGEVVPGRHLHLRGLRDGGRWPDRLGNRLPEHVQGDWQMVSLEWEVVPAVRADDPDAAQWYQHDVAEVEYRIDPPLDWDLHTASGVGGGSVDATPGRLGTRGAYGPYPLSADAREVSFTVTPYLHRHSGGGLSHGATGDVVDSSHRPIGRVVIDLGAASARWERAAPVH